MIPHGTHVFLLLLALTPQHSSTQKLVVVAPQSIGVALDGPGHVNVSVTVIGGSARRHTVTLQLKEPSGRGVGEEETVLTETDTLTPVKIPLSSTILQEARQAETGSTFHLVAQCQTTTNHLEAAEISTFLRLGFVFLQTDKPTYRRGETVHIRLLTADELLIPHAESLILQITDTANDTKTFSVPGSDAIYEQDFVLHDGATSGDWTVSVFRGGQDVPLTTTSFRVAEDTLHPFAMAVHIPDNIITNESKKISIDVIARESFGTPIFGQVEFTIYLLREGTRSRIQSLSAELQAGRTHVTYALSDLYDLSPTLTFPHLLGAHLEVTALLKDDSGRLRQVSDQSCVFTTSQYELVLPRLDRTVHPDVPFYPLQLVVRRYDDVPAAHTNVDIIVKEEGSESTVKETTDENGYIYREFTRPSHITIVAGDNGTKKTNYSIAITESLEPKILISPRRSEVKVGSQSSLRIYRSDHVTPWFYVITCRGRTIKSGRSMDQSLDLAVDKTMVPHVNVFVWSVYGNITVTDTATITVLGYCEKFGMDVFFNGQEATTGQLLRPGDDVTLEFTGDYHKVALRIVDSLAFNDWQQAQRSGTEIQNALKQRHSIGETLQLLGSEQAKSEYLSPFIQPQKRRRRRSTHDHTEEVVLTPHIIVEHDPGLELQEMVRSDFRTSWMFTVANLPDMDMFTRRRRLEAHIPDSITSWSVLAVGVDDQLPLCVAQTNIMVKKEHFLKVFLPSTAKVGEEIEARASVYNLVRHSRRKQPIVRVAHQEGLCNNFNKRRRRRHRPWTVSWTVKPSRVGDFTVTVGYRKDVVRHTIRVQQGNGTGSILHTNIVDVTSSSKILTTEELILLLPPMALGNDDYYEYTDYDGYEYDDYAPIEDLARSASSRSQREAGINDNIHQLRFTIRPKKPLSQWNVSIELLTGFILDERSLEKLKKDNKDLQSYSIAGNVLLLFMNEMEKDSETVISFLLSAKVNVAKRNSGEIRIEHATLSGPVVVHRYQMDGSHPEASEPVTCQNEDGIRTQHP